MEMESRIKGFILLLLVLTVTSKKRFILTDIAHQLLKDIDFAHLKETINKILDMVGSKSTAHQCEVACREVATKDILDAGCPFFCSGFQQLVNQLHIEDEKYRKT